jgi:hypothetical protein
MANIGREKHRRATGLENVVALVRCGTALGNVVIARHRNHATPGCGARHVRVLEHIRATVHTRTFAVPDAKHTVVFVGARRCEAQLLRAPQRSRRQFFVDARLEHHMVCLEVFFGLDQGLVIGAQRGAPVAADEARRVLADALVAHTLHGQLDQSLHPTHKSVAVV